MSDHPSTDGISLEQLIEHYASARASDIGQATLDRLEELQRLRAAPEPGAWQPIETAPKSSRAILVYCSTIKCTFGVTWDSTDGCWIHFGGRGELTEDLPSYWMPMPEAPNV